MKLKAERDALRAQVPELEHAVLARAEAHKRTSLARRDAPPAVSVPPAETTPAPEKFDAVMEAVKLAQDAGLPVRFTSIPERKEGAAARPHLMLSALDVRPAAPPSLRVRASVNTVIATRVGLSSSCPGSALA
ncbi:hypothetical protein HRD49_03630 [Corallococcus exiguus]|uniref:hypothetical protein n=1 Tax=Corallococcus exiguus TaxID=83462 RepID=UPI00156027AE|nr:hypothetical protein [Corallococcus exiguus]NRD60830.1 hypothetical protein [Corallococcus exiguus]